MYTNCENDRESNFELEVEIGRLSAGTKTC